MLPNMLPYLKEMLYPYLGYDYNEESIEKICRSLDYMIKGQFKKGFYCFANDIDLVDPTNPSPKMKRFINNEVRLLDEVELKFDLTEEELSQVFLFLEIIYDEITKEMN